MYIETNFLVGYASGRDPGAVDLLAAASKGIRLAVPGVCFMEALSLIEAERKRTHRLGDDLGNERRSAELDLVSSDSPGLALRLAQAQSGVSKRFEVFSDRLDEVFLILSDVAEIISVSSTVLRSHTDRKAIAEPTDNLILACILDHAADHHGTRKAFFSENRKDFSQNTFVAGLLKDAGIKYFGQAAKLLEWAGSGSGA
ncbi:PIN domain-containing protein [Tundrisphaera sp. TA3]|uniref:PIN domain-containing protein n=1 Tax=Tundrisphaera sp. TA3 TaxID=3435775 RepID=UPI003EB7BA33